MKIVLHSGDINLQEYWKKALSSEAILIDDFESLFELSASLIIINYSAFLDEPESAIRKLTKSNNKILVLHRTPEIATAKKMLLYGASGYGNALMKEHFILSAIDTIEEGMIWLHPEFTSQLIHQLPDTSQKDNSELLLILSEREKEVVLLLKEGDTYKTIAQKLSISPRTVKAHASSSYAKLNVKDRLALALLLK